MLRPDCVGHSKQWKILKDMGILDHRTCIMRNLYAGQEAMELDWNPCHGTVDWFKIGKEYVKAVYHHPADLTYMQGTSCKMPGWLNHKLASRLQREIATTSDMQMTQS